MYSFPDNLRKPSCRRGTRIKGKHESKHCIWKTVHSYFLRNSMWLLVTIWGGGGGWIVMTMMNISTYRDSFWHCINHHTLERFPSFKYVDCGTFHEIQNSPVLLVKWLVETVNYAQCVLYDRASEKWMCECPVFTNPISIKAETLSKNARKTKICNLLIHLNLYLNKSILSVFTD